VLITLNKYRKAHQMLQEAEGSRPASATDAKPGQGHGVKDSRSMSVTREVTRVVRV